MGSVRLRWWALFLLLGTFAWGQETPLDLFRTFRNESRQSLPPWSEALAESCRGRAAVLAASGRLSHQDDQGRGPGLQMASEGQPPGEFGEVLGAGRNLASVWEAWLNSPTHRAVLAAPGWTRWAWGSAEHNGTTVWVARFWRP